MLSVLKQKSVKSFTLQEFFHVYHKIQLNTFRKTFQSSTTPHNNQNKVFLIFGQSTSGKTVVSYYLCGDQLQYGIEEKKKVPYLIPVKQRQGASVEKAPITITSRCPNVMIHQQPFTQSQSESKQILFIQIPDIKQLREEQKTVQYLFLQKVLKSFRNLHLLIVITQLSLDDAASLIQNFQCITSLLDLQDSTTQQTLSNSLSIIINKTDSSNQLADVRQKLQDLNNDIIQQENQHLYTVIDTIIKDDRVYMIKQSQPQQAEQQELLEDIVKNSECKAFDDLRLNLIQLEEIVDSDEAISGLVEKEQLLDQWLQNCLYFGLLAKYLADDKSREDNFPSIQPLLKEYQSFLKEQQWSQFEGNISSNTKSSLKNIIKLISEKDQQSNQNAISALQIHLQQLKAFTLEQLGIHISKDSSESSTQPNPPQELSSSNEACYHILAKISSDLLLTIEYLTEILDYNGLRDQAESQSLERKLDKKCLQELFDEMINKLKEEFNEFDLNLLSASKGKKTGKKKAKKQIIITKSYTIDDLKDQILTKFKAKPSHQLLSHILTLPHTHFKLYMLCLQIPSKIQSFIQRSFAEFLTLIKEIVKILKVAELYVEQIIFLLLVPDWNRIQSVIQKIEKKGRKCILDEGIKETVEILNVIGVYAVQKRRNKLGERVLKLVDNIVVEIADQNSSISPKEIKVQRQRLTKEKIDEKIFFAEALKLYCQPIQGYPEIVERVKLKEQTNPVNFEKANQFLQLISQTKI